MVGKKSKHTLIMSYLDDSGLCRIDGDVAPAVQRGIYQALCDIPEPVLKKCIKSKIRLVLADHENYSRQAPSRSNGSYSSKQRTVRINANRTPSQIRRTMRHEMGHAIDDINKRGRHFASLKSSRFLKETDDYLKAKKGEPPTELYFEHDRSFRRDHKPLYEKKHKSHIYAELSAELFGKFCGISADKGVFEADRFLTANYSGAWTAYKTDVVPQIGDHIANTALEQQTQKRAVAKAPDQGIEAWQIKVRDRLYRDLGRKNVKAIRLDDESNLQIKVPRGFSRSHFEQMGIKSPDQNLRRTNHKDHDVITIPKQHLPMSLKFNDHALGQSQQKAENQRPSVYATIKNMVFPQRTAAASHNMIGARP